MTALVMTYISLSASHTFRKGFLGDSETFANGFYRVHSRIVVPLLIVVNSAAVLNN